MPSPAPASRSIPLWIIGLLCLVSLWRMADLTRFMLDASRAELAEAPHLRYFEDEALQKPFFPKHSCFSSYAVAQQLALDGAENLYLPELYRDPVQETAVHEEIGELLRIDTYQYPPPFLLLPWALARAGGGFFGARGLFYFLTLAGFGLCLWLSQRWLAAGRDASGQSAQVWLAWPLVLLAGTSLTTLQIGNVHPFVMVLSMLGMLAVVRGRDLVGGALLGFVTVGKIFPGLLLVYLIARGKHRAVAWSLGFGALYVIASLGLFGMKPYTAFFDYQLGRLASGEAFDFAFGIPRAMLVNSSFMGIPFRWQGLGWIEDGQALGQALSWIAGFLLIGCAWWLGRAWRERGGLDDQAQVRSERQRFHELGLWLALLLLAQMRSPFLPWGYGSFVVLWLLAVLLATPAGGQVWLVRLICLAAAWCVVSTSLPLPFGGPTLDQDFAFASVGTLLALVLAGYAVLAARRAGQG